MLKFSSHLFPQFISAGDKTDLYDGKQTWELRKPGGQTGRPGRDLLSAGWSTPIG